MIDSVSFIPGRFPALYGPLGRYLPPLPDGVGQTWLNEQVQKGAWVIDPFGASPRLLIETARAGYRVLAAVNNPIGRFLTELYANPPTEEALRAALVDLAGEQKVGERLESQIRLMYQTECAQCGRTIEAQAFIWEREKNTLVGKIYSCPFCKDSGERPATHTDSERAVQSAATGLHRARALERVASITDPDRAYAEEALSVYPPRAVYVLFKLVNRLDILPPQRRWLACALLLAVFDQSNGLWHHPPTRYRPKQLSLPTRYLEKNIWLALEDAVSAWPAALNDVSSSAATVPMTTWPELPTEDGGICLFEGRLKDLAVQMSAGSEKAPELKAAICAIPRPNQAFWTLSALWAGWLWSHSASAPFKSVLRRRRFDWTWHIIALTTNLVALKPLIHVNTSCLGLIGEAEPGYLSAAILAGELSGLRLIGVALRSGQGQAQIHWQREDFELAPVGDRQRQELVRQKVSSYLRQRCEPASYLRVHSAALVGLAQDHAVSPPSVEPPAEALRAAEEAIEKTLSSGSPFTRLNASSRSLEVGQWWLDDISLQSHRIDLPLADRVEMSTVQFLQANKAIRLEDLDAALCQEMRGLLTPDYELIHECLKSYAEEDSQASHTWHLRSQDQPSSRRSDLAEMQELLIGLGKNLGYYTSTPSLGEDAGAHPPVYWGSADGSNSYLFYLTASGVLGKIIHLAPEIDARLGGSARKVIVLPGGRAGLVEYKLLHNPYMRRIIENDWSFVKYRHVRWLAEYESLSLDRLDEALKRDPLANRDPQIPLL